MSAFRRMTSCSASATLGERLVERELLLGRDRTPSPRRRPSPTSRCRPGVISRRPPPVESARTATPSRDALNSPVVRTSSLSDPRATRAVGARRTAPPGLGLDRSGRGDQPSGHGQRRHGPQVLASPSCALRTPPAAGHPAASRWDYRARAARRLPRRTQARPARAPRFRITTGRGSKPARGLHVNGRPAVDERHRLRRHHQHVREPGDGDRGPWRSCRA